MKANLLLLALVLGFAKGQVLRKQCADVSLFPDLDIERLEGEWYEISRTPNPWEQGSCTQINQTAIQNGSSLLMQWEEVLRFFKGPSYKFAISTGNPNPNDVKSKLSLNFLHPSLPYPTPFHVIDTDYDNYFITYTCHRYFFPDGFLANQAIFTEYAWIMSRKRTLDSGIIGAKMAMLDSQDVNVAWMESVDQNDCDDLYGRVRRDKAQEIHDQILKEVDS